MQVRLMKCYEWRLIKMTLEEYIEEVKESFMVEVEDEKYFNRPEVQDLIKESFSDGITASGCGWTLFMFYPALPRNY